jgi:hypothetical protein
LPLEAVILEVDGQAVGSPTDLARFISAAGPGKEVTLTFYSNGKVTSAPVVLGGSTPAPEYRNGLSSPAPAQNQFGKPTLPPRSLEDRLTELERRLVLLEGRLSKLEQGARNP